MLPAHCGGIGRRAAVAVPTRSHHAHARERTPWRKLFQLPPPPDRARTTPSTTGVVRCAAASSGDSGGVDVGGSGRVGTGGPLIASTSKEGGGGGGGSVKMEAARIWFGMPAEGAVERLSVVCAHCNAKLTPKEMDYECKMDKLAVGLRPVFKPLQRDDATNDFLMRSSRRPLAVNWSMAAACTYLRKFMSLTDANAILGRGRMHVLSREQAADLLRDSFEETAAAAAAAAAEGEQVSSVKRELSGVGAGAGRVLLDVGAGEGEVTEKLRDGGGFTAVVATEASPPMVRRLRAKKFDCVVGAYDVSGVVTAAEEAGVPVHPDGFDGIALLNVLDRCDTPFTLLAQLRAMLRPGSGRLILAVVIPFRPFVEDGKTHRAPKERLPLPSNGSWENGVNQLWEQVIKPSGFKVERLARVPYISEGDQRHGAYILDDAVFVLSVPLENAR